jgi:hypothetical protein
VDFVAVDQDRRSLRYLRDAMDQRFPKTRLRLLEADFTDHLQLPPVDGILTANACHYLPWQKQTSLFPPLARRPQTGRALDRHRVRRRQGKPLGAVLDVNNYVPNDGAGGGFRGTRADQIGAVALPGWDVRGRSELICR